MGESIAMQSAVDQLAQVASKNLKPTELAAIYRAQIAQLDSKLNSVLATSSDEVSSSAASFSGLTVLIKDNIEAIGLPATAGSLALADREVKSDSPVVSRLRTSGITVLGATNLSEWANIRSGNSTSGWSAVGGLTANPWALDRSAGGSSSGSGAAVAAGLATFAVGTETDGSIICPAALTGCVGIKPTVGVVPTAGIVPISKSQDSPGPIARTVADAALLLSVLAENDALAQVNFEQKLRVGVVETWLTGHDKTDALFEHVVTVLAAAGIELRKIDVAPRDEQSGDDEGTVLFHELLDDLDEYLANRPGDGVKSLADVVAFNREHAEAELAFFGQEFLELALRTGGRNQKYRTARARNLDWAIKRTLAPALDNVDVLIAPAYGPAWLATLGQGDVYVGGEVTGASAVSGWPIGTLPMGFVDGLPIGLAVVTRANCEPTLISAMAQFERVLGLGILQPTFAASVGQTQVGSVGHAWSQDSPSA